MEKKMSEVADDISSITNSFVGQDQKDTAISKLRSLVLDIIPASDSEDSLNKYRCSVFSLRFYDKETENRFVRFLASHQTVKSSMITIFMPSLFTFGLLTVGYLIVFRHQFPMYIAIIGCLINSVQLASAIYYCYLIYQQSKESKEALHVDTMDIVKLDRISENIEVYNWEESSANYGTRDTASKPSKDLLVKRNRSARLIGIWCSLACYLVLFVYGYYTYTRTAFGQCKSFCTMNIPIVSLVVIQYIPIHFSQCAPVSWLNVLFCSFCSKVVVCVLLEAISGVNMIVDYFYSVVCVVSLWIIIDVIFWFIYQKNLTIFVQRDILTNLAVQEERKYENNVLLA